ncbi:MAG TPA: pilus assembly protein N-terminal domain-containing protein [Phenylobacterium sp.]|nr:pilus assembly protein N-terminal domain-containing protein [Phenylobacterium sp.]
MRRRLPLLAAATLVAMGLAAAAQAASLTVPIDQSLRIVLPPGAQNVVIGNPAVADVTVLDSRTALLLGRAYGATNLLVTDARGRVLMDRQVAVAGVESDRVAIYRGPAGQGVSRVENYACATRCERTPMPGETDLDFNRYQAGYSGYAARAKEAAGATSSAGGGGGGGGDRPQ